ncbi:MULTISPECIES: aldo/keto reductase [Rhodomicrobium]|uniref:aldo/keto reductase n=1 Tax=Rhodomicrobium TaxID=1068 RepID=UPI000B4B6D4B|nr:MULTISPECIES: aldo/keto reductase [Rhodomicrobium]
MLKRPIPSSGEMLPVIGCGTYQTFDVGAAAATRAPLRGVLAALFAAGGSVIDSSPMYGKAERVAGDLLAEEGMRERAFVATKVWTRGREAGIAEMERSFALLKVSTIDLMQIHNLLDWRTHLATLRGWKAEGRVRYLGITHYTAGAHADLAAIMRSEPIDFVQFNYALDDRAAETSLLPLAAERGIAVLINRPLGQGNLLRRLARKPLPDVAAELGAASWAELALKYLISNEAVTCLIPATSKPEHMAMNARAGAGPLPDAEMRRQILAAAGV